MAAKNVLYENGRFSTGDGGGVTDVEVNGTSVVNAQGVAEIPAIPDEVVANPSGTASTNLTKLQVGNGIYAIPSGGGGLVDVTNKLTVHSGITLASDCAYKAYKNDNIVTLNFHGGIQSGSASVGTIYTLFDLDYSITPIMGSAAFALGGGSSPQYVRALTDGVVRVTTGMWASFCISWFIA